MADIFLSVLEISVSMSLMIAALLLLAPLLNKRYAAKWKYMIWIVLALQRSPKKAESTLPCLI